VQYDEQRLLERQHQLLERIELAQQLQQRLRGAQRAQAALEQQLLEQELAQLLARRAS